MGRKVHPHPHQEGQSPRHVHGHRYAPLLKQHSANATQGDGLLLAHNFLCAFLSAEGLEEEYYGELIESCDTDQDVKDLHDHFQLHYHEAIEQVSTSRYKRPVKRDFYTVCKKTGLVEFANKVRPLPPSKIIASWLVVVRPCLTTTLLPPLPCCARAL
jgi:hypothetical protein